MLFWTMKDVTDVTKLSETTIRRMVKRGTFPSPHILVGNRKVWKPDDVRRWADQITKNDDLDAEKSTGWLSRFA